MSSFKVAAGKADQTGTMRKTEFTVGGKLSGTSGNDTFAFADNVYATFRAIDIGDGTDKLTIGDDSIFKIGSKALIEGIVTGSGKDNHLELNVGGYLASLDFGKGEGDSVNFTFDNVTLNDEGSSLAFGSCLNVGDDNFTINGSTAGWEQSAAVYIGDGVHKAWLTRDENNGVTLSRTLA